ncbi:hypothetical protein BURK1_01959 [Burkholderiales bacterium]|nr:hypothetical protein BURK1_01959 [Burkholderiales bacterium]
MSPTARGPVRSTGIDEGECALAADARAPHPGERLKEAAR